VPLSTFPKMFIPDCSLMRSSIGTLSEALGLRSGSSSSSRISKKEGPCYQGHKSAGMRSMMP
jgi:hypothetical protein